MAGYRAAIFGTEDNCAFYMKVGACRHGNVCNKLHVKPTFSQTVLLKNFYLNPSHQYSDDNEVLYNENFQSRQEIQEHFDNFYEDVFVECEDKFKSERSADRAVGCLNNRWFGGKPIYAELSPVTNINKAFCVQNKFGNCSKGPYCNFLHIKRVSPAIEQYLYGKMSKRFNTVQSAEDTNLEEVRVRSQGRVIQG
ncbi:hypothetical protein O3M35_012880 [Rhynocoris fuscipes]|uniref:C3H1-type domain-containing protein n=1 Tax=Rhynocoris fuscipes TaxID=488301 RepID=A0AAW1CFG4_9HEMI